MAVNQKTIEKSFSKQKIRQQEDLSYLAKDIIANAGIGIYIVQNGRFVYVSDLYQKMTGFTDRELLGASSLDNIYPDDKEKVRKKAVKCLKEDRCEPYEYRFVTKKKEIMWVLETVASILYQGERATLGSFIDITERKRVEEKLKKEEQLFRAITDQSSDIIVLMNLEGVITYVNPVVEKALGFKPEERIGARVFERIHPDDLQSLMDKFKKLSRDTNMPVLQGEMRLRHKDGSYRTFEVVGSNIVNNNVVENIIVNYRDITERKKAEESLRQSEEKYRTILENIQEGYFEVDLAGNLIFFNDAVCELIGYSKDETDHMSYRVFTDENTAKKVYQAFNKVFKTGEPTREFDWKIIRKGGEERYIEASVSLQKDFSGKALGFKGLIRDITERKQIHQQLNHMATHDALTGLPNRTLFMDRLHVALARSKRNHNKLAVMMIDLDHFKDINDNLGHLVGDKLLKEIGSRLTGILRHNDTVARLGGDEFVILLSDLEKVEYAAGVAKVILKAFQKPFQVAEDKITSNASIGIAVYPNDCEDEESLLKKSDMAMYAVKTRGRNNYKFFSNIVN